MPHNRGNRQRGEGKKPSRSIVLTVLVLLLATAGLVMSGIRSSSGQDAPVRTARAAGAPHYDSLEIPHDPAGKGIQRVDYEGFSLGFNKENGTADWAGWELLGSETYGEIPRSDNFWRDESVDGCPERSDYTRSGYDRGHLCPAADQKWSERAMNDSFSMANMTPQAGALNRGAWNTLEEKERLWARRDSALVIVAGPVYSDSDRERIGNGVRVPGAFYKVILAPYLDEPRAIGFIYPNQRCPGNMRDYSMSVDEVERITGLDFFPYLPDDIEDRVESVYSFKQWDSR